MDNKRNTKRIMFHCVNGTGLGHVNRAINIAKILLKKDIASNIIIESDGKYSPSKLPKKISFINLKHTNHEMYKDPSLREEQEKDIKKIIKKFNPDIFVVDNETPLFISRKELENVKKIFVLRSLEEKFLLQKLPSLKENYDEIIIPHSKREFNFLYSKKTIEELSSEKINFVGPIIKDKKTGNVKKTYDFLATVGGGGIHHNPKKPGTFFRTSEKNLKVICDVFYGLKEKHNKLKFCVLCGQNFPKDSFKELLNKYGKKIDIKYSSENPLRLFKKTKVLIAQLGYNTTFEAIRYNIPSVFFIKKAIPESQFLRGRWVEKNNLGVFILELNKKRLLSELQNILSNKEKIKEIKNNLKKFDLEINEKRIQEIFKK